MRFEVKKVDNCFSDAQSYEYKIPITGQELIQRMKDWKITENHKFRRPMFQGEKNGVHTKGILRAAVFRASFPDERWKEEKAALESWLEGLDG